MNQRKKLQFIFCCIIWLSLYTWMVVPTSYSLSARSTQSLSYSQHGWMWIVTVFIYFLIFSEWSNCAVNRTEAWLHLGGWDAKGCDRHCGHNHYNHDYRREVQGVGTWIYAGDIYVRQWGWRRWGLWNISYQFFVTFWKSVWRKHYHSPPPI